MRVRAALLLPHVVLLLLTATCSYCMSNNNQAGSSRIKVQRDPVLGRYYDECFSDDARVNQTLYKLMTPGGGGGDTQQSKSSCHHVLSVMPFIPYKGLVQIGEPPQLFKALFDTASDVIWVPHSKCRQNGSPWDNSERTRFASENSTTFSRMDKRRVSLDFANGMELKGWWVRDVVRLADLEEKSRSLVVANQPLALICHINGPEQPFRPLFDARVGLSCPHHTSGGVGENNEGEPQQKTLFENMIANKLVREPIFSIHTHPKAAEMGAWASQAQEPQTGEIIFGQIDESLYTGDITWTPVTRLPHWQIRVHSIKFLEASQARSAADQVRAAACSHGCEAVIDSSQDAIMGPDAEIEALNEKLGFVRNPQNPGLFFKQSSCAGLLARNMSLAIQFGDTHLELKPEMYIYEWEKSYGQKVCMSGLRSHGKGLPPATWTLGSPFISNFYTIFDYGQRRVGVAQPKQV